MTGTPLHLWVNNIKGRPILESHLRSRVTREGAATWRIPIPADDPGGVWSLEVEAPLSGLKKKAGVQVDPPPAISESSR